MAAVTLMSMRNMSTQQKMDQVVRLKNDCDTLRNHILVERNKILDSCLTDMGARAPPIGNLRIKSRQVFRGHMGKIYTCKLIHDDCYVLSVGQDGYVLVWDAYTSAKVDALPLEASWVLSAGASRTDNLIATGGFDTAVTVYKLFELDDLTDGSPNRRVRSIRSRTPQCIFRGHSGLVSDIEFVSGSTLVSSSADLTLRTWDLHSGETIQEYRDHLGDINCVRLCPKDNNIVATGAADSMIKVWDLRTRPGASVQTFVASFEVNQLDFFPDGNALCSAGEDGVVRMFDRRSDGQVGQYGGGVDGGGSGVLGPPAVTAVKFTPSGRLICAGRRDGSWGSYDIMTGQWTSHLAHTQEITSIQVGDDGRRLYTSCWDSTIRSWEPVT
uniref:ARAD1C24838p n=1 Tax=Blastobotrys adeninivorans TaxID=409370 RepID=A0A060T7U7_BLAAD